MENRKIRACCFDLGNTLSNDKALTETSIDETAERLADEGCISDSSEFVRLFHEINAATQFPFISHTYGEEKIFEKLFRRLGVTRIVAEEALERYRRIVDAHTEAAPELREALEFLFSRGVRTAILSNERSARVDAYLAQTGLRDFFDIVVVSEALGVEKPDLRIFREILSRLDVPPEEAGSVAMFGDNSIADGACKELGMRFVLVNGYKNREWYFERGAEYSPDYEIEKVTKESLEEILSKSATED